MDNAQFFTIIAMLAAGFGWMIHQISDISKRVACIESRVTVIETILAMMGMPVKTKSDKS